MEAIFFGRLDQEDFMAQFTHDEIVKQLIARVASGLAKSESSITENSLLIIKRLLTT